MYFKEVLHIKLYKIRLGHTVWETYQWRGTDVASIFASAKGKVRLGWSKANLNTLLFNGNIEIGNGTDEIEGDKIGLHFHSQCISDSNNK